MVPKARGDVSCNKVDDLLEEASVLDLTFRYQSLEAKH
jgi:hypothetical protein